MNPSLTATNRIRPLYASQVMVAAQPSLIRPEEVLDLFRTVTFYVGLVLIFFRVSGIHQWINYSTQTNLYYLYIFGLPPLIGVLVTGGLRRSFQGRPCVYFAFFALWMLLATPFSFWRSSSLSRVGDYLRTDLTMMLVVAGLTLTWKEVRRVFYVITASAVVNLFIVRVFQTANAMRYAGREGLQAGTVANPNDLAAHLLLVLPFLFWAAGMSKSWFFRLLMVAGVFYGLLIILRTGSRGAEVGLLAGILCLIFKGTARQRLALVVLAPIALGAVLAAVPSETLRRLRSFEAASLDPEDADVSALQSQASRTYILKMSLRYTLENPIFGVGPGQFSGYEGSHNFLPGKEHGSYLDTHNTFTQASAECGLPGGLFFLAGVLSSIGLFAKLLREATSRPDCQDIRQAAFWAMLACCAFYSSIFFLNFAYLFYEPFLAGLSVAVFRAGKEEMRVRALPAAVAA